MRAKQATFTFWVDKSLLKVPKMVNLASFWKTEDNGQKVLPDYSVLIGQKLVENAKIPKFKCDILGDFQTLCWCHSQTLLHEIEVKAFVTKHISNFPAHFYLLREVNENHLWSNG